MREGRRVLLQRAVTLFAVPAAMLMGPKAALATPQGAADHLRKLEAGDAVPGRISIDMADIAENGNAVPITIRVDSPMTEADHVQAIHVVAEGNPSPGVASFLFNPSSGRAEVKFRVRLAQSQRIVAVARMNDGSLRSAAREVKVALGGCGG
ncbi:hypothetical protein BWI17_11380 [Betaproteobacteria bacterium GR16-43]|nr:hypothetical protein BWI17_11380 [Betaproteobacteria bacterium GR16-43]